MIGIVSLGHILSSSSRNLYPNSCIGSSRHHRKECERGGGFKILEQKRSESERNSRWYRKGGNGGDYGDDIEEGRRWWRRVRVFNKKGESLLTQQHAPARPTLLSRTAALSHESPLRWHLNEGKGLSHSKTSLFFTSSSPSPLETESNQLSRVDG